jgi:hypothetical protein
LPMKHHRPPPCPSPQLKRRQQQGQEGGQKPKLKIRKYLRLFSTNNS